MKICLLLSILLLLGLYSEICEADSVNPIFPKVQEYHQDGLSSSRTKINLYTICFGHCMMGKCLVSERGMILCGIRCAKTCKKGGQ